MSMGVGDSTDLITGGGGGIRVFWRSRTDFEKKLLLVLAVLSAAVVALVVAVAILGARDAAGNHNCDGSSSKSPGYWSYTDEPTEASSHHSLTSPAAGVDRFSNHMPSPADETSSPAKSSTPALQ
ncbi:uncharacterized protein [Panulirus ornatus]|uniref:uncharacterized protein isoform X2 n=1 Tax=Panulirus ornatus TaxID=150431 RepID=UPI003A879573